MGYRSDVYIALDKVTYLKAKIIKAHELAISTLENEFQQRSSSDHLCFVGESWKWYQNFGFEDVDAVENLLAWFEEQQSKTPNPLYGFIRIGEDVNDVECYGDPDHFGLHIQQTVIFDD